jgi:hypothetical protein
MWSIAEAMDEEDKSYLCNFVAQLISLNEVNSMDRGNGRKIEIKMMMNLLFLYQINIYIRGLIWYNKKGIIIVKFQRAFVEKSFM